MMKWSQNKQPTNPVFLAALKKVHDETGLTGDELFRVAMEFTEHVTETIHEEEPSTSQHQRHIKEDPAP